MSKNIKHGYVIHNRKKSLNYTTLKLNCLAKVVEMILAHDNNYMSSILPGHLDTGIPQVDGPRPTRSPNSGSDGRTLCRM